MDIKTLDKLKPGEWGRIYGISLSGGIRRRLQDLGFVPGGYISCLFSSPGGEISAYNICGAVIAVRRCDTEGIELSEYGQGEILKAELKEEAVYDIKEAGGDRHDT